MADGLTTELIAGYLNKEGVSDFHFAAGAPPHVRIKKELKKVGERALADQDIKDLISRIDHSVDTSLVPRDFALTFEGRRLRCNLDRTWQGLDLAMRLLPSEIKPLKELGLPETLYALMEQTLGFILICGQTGSGKSTTLASLIDYVNHRSCKNIVTIEDPIEYIIKRDKALVHQREIGNGESFLPHLRNALRQAPDIIVLGEIRGDKDTLETAIQAAETGHLVLSTMHTTSVDKTILRIVDMAKESESPILSSLSSVLKAVIVQRLIRGRNDQVRLAYEICIVNEGISNLIRQGKQHQILNAMQSASGCVTMNDSLEKLVENGYIDREEAKRNSYDPDSLE